jgi:hypothetical protein
MSLQGFAEALTAALELHANYPDNQPSLEGKRGAPSRFAAPEDLPSLVGKYQSQLDYQGKVVPSCSHCHQVGESLRRVARSQDHRIPDPLLFPYPHPKSIGLILDPQRKATVTRVLADSPAARAGFQAGDELLRLDGQPLISIADIQWVLHNAGDSDTLRADVRRGDESVQLDLALPSGWRRASDISWRATSWDLRRMVTGGLVFESLSPEELRQSRLSDRQLALRVKHVGQYGEHAAGKQAGFQKGDILTAVDDLAAPLSESQLLEYLLREKKPGDRVRLSVRRGGKNLQLELPIRE